MRLLTLAILTLSATLALLSCVALPTVQAQQSEVVTSPGARVIVKLHVPADEPTIMRRIREKLPFPERVSYLQAMSGDAHVLIVVAPATENSVATLIADLRATNLFEFVELDRMKGIRK